MSFAGLQVGVEPSHPDRPQAGAPMDDLSPQAMSAVGLKRTPNWPEVVLTNGKRIQRRRRGVSSCERPLTYFVLFESTSITRA